MSIYYKHSSVLTTFDGLIQSQELLDEVGIIIISIL